MKQKNPTEGLLGPAWDHRVRKSTGGWRIDERVSPDSYITFSELFASERDAQDALDFFRVRGVMPASGQKLTRKNPIRRAGLSRKKYLARPSQISRARPTQRLRTRRAVNLRQGEPGFFPNASDRKNPRIRVSSGSLRATPQEKAAYQSGHLRGKKRFVMESGTLGDRNFYAVQVKRKSAWIFLAGFPRGETGRKMATNYATLLANRFPRKKFGVFWPDTKKNPVPELKTPPDWFPTIAAAKHWFMVHGYEPGNARGEYVNDDFQIFVRRDVRGIRARWRKNPAPRELTPQLAAARKLYREFSGERGNTVRETPIPPALRTGLAIGPVLMIGYSAIRDGKRERYAHTFARNARPLLAASHDGRTLYLLGGAYRFTDRGIVDRKPRTR